MKVSITEARRRLPELVKRVRKNRETIEITVHDEVVAQLRSPDPEPEPGAAARAMLKIMAELPRHRGRKHNISGHVREYLYGRKGVIR